MTTTAKPRKPSLRGKVRQKALSLVRIIALLDDLDAESFDGSICAFDPITN